MAKCRLLASLHMRENLLASKRSAKQIKLKCLVKHMFCSDFEMLNVFILCFCFAICTLIFFVISSFVYAIGTDDIRR